jgi:hypothetical protein
VRARLHMQQGVPNQTSQTRRSRSHRSMSPRVGAAQTSSIGDRSVSQGRPTLRERDPIRDRQCPHEGRTPLRARRTLRAAALPRAAARIRNSRSPSTPPSPAPPLDRPRFSRRNISARGRVHTSPPRTLRRSRLPLAIGTDSCALEHPCSSSAPAAAALPPAALVQHPVSRSLQLGSAARHILPHS